MKLRALLASFSLAVITFLSSYTASAQLKKNLDYSGFFDSYYYHQKYSFVAGANLPFYFGDLCSGFGCNSISPGFTIGAGIKLWPRVYFGGDFNYFTLSTGDKEPDRGFSFSSANYELLAYGRYYLIEDIVRKHRDLKKKPKFFKPYLMAGIGLNYANVTPGGYIIDSTGTGDTLSVADYEGQNYPKLIFNVPLGVGFQFDVSRRVNILLEGVYRFTLSDYVDGVSLAAGADKNDSYLTFNLKVQYNPWAKRMKRKRKKVDPENIHVVYDSTSSTGNSSETTPSEGEDIDLTNTGEGDSYEGGVEESGIDNGPEGEQGVETEESTEPSGEEGVETEEDEYYEGGFEEESSEEEQSSEEDYDDGW